MIVLHGPGGTGKTELAKAFGRWWQNTGGVARPEWVIWHSFGPGAANFGLDGMITQIGLELFGADFARLDARAARRGRGVLAGPAGDADLGQLRNVRSMPDVRGTPPLDAAGCQELPVPGASWPRAAPARSSSPAARRGLAGDGDARQAACGVTLSRIEVAGLTPQEAAEYAEVLLAPFPAAAPRRATRGFGELMQWLAGHPLSMRMRLPQLDTSSPEDLLAGLRGTAPLPGWDDGHGDRLTSLPTSTTSYSHDHLDPARQKLLVAVCCSTTPPVLTSWPSSPAADGVPPRFRGPAGRPGVRSWTPRPGPGC